MNLPSLTVAAALVIALLGCGKKRVDASAELQKGFREAQPEVQQEVQKVAADLQLGKYAEAVAAMNRALWVQQQQQLQARQAAALSEQQKRAAEAVILQTRQALQQNPNLNSPQLHKAMSDLILRTHGEN